MGSRDHTGFCCLCVKWCWVAEQPCNTGAWLVLDGLEHKKEQSGIKSYVGWTILDYDW